MYLEAPVGDIYLSHPGAVISPVGIADNSVYLASPIVEAGKAITFVHAQSRHPEAQHLEDVQTLISEVRLLRAQVSSIAEQGQQPPKIAQLPTNAQERPPRVRLSILLPMLFIIASLLLCIAGLVYIACEVRSLGNQLEQESAKVQSIATQSAETKSSLDVLSGQVQSIASFLSAPNHVAEAEKANALLVKHSGKPLKALWEALSDTKTVAAVAMAVVMDRRCGLERRSTLADGEMKGNMVDGELTLNQNKYGLTPLIMAALANRADVMRLLIAAGAKVEVREDTYALTTLSTAAIVNNPTTTELLIDHGAELDPDFVHIPLQHAAYHMSDKAIEVLVRRGADKNLVRLGESSLQIFLRREKELPHVPTGVKASIRRSFGI